MRDLAPAPVGGGDVSMIVALFHVVVTTMSTRRLSLALRNWDS